MILGHPIFCKLIFADRIWQKIDIRLAYHNAFFEKLLCKFLFTDFDINRLNKSFFEKKGKR